MGGSKKKGCKGWNYHVFPLGAEKCCLCGKTREEVRAERGPQTQEGE